MNLVVQSTSRIEAISLYFRLAVGHMALKTYSYGLKVNKSVHSMYIHPKSLFGLHLETQWNIMAEYVQNFVKMQ